MDLCVTEGLFRPCNKFRSCRLNSENLPKKLSKPYLHCDSKYKTRDFFDDNFSNNNKEIKYLLLSIIINHSCIFQNIKYQQNTKTDICDKNRNDYVFKKNNNKTVRDNSCKLLSWHQVAYSAAGK